MIQWMDEEGKTQPLLDKPGLFVNPRFSPDGQRLAVANDDARSGIWIYDIRRDTLAPLTGERDAYYPVWTPDGKYIVYAVRQGISAAPADGSGRPSSLDAEQGISIPHRLLARWQNTGIPSNGTSGLRYCGLFRSNLDAGGLKAGTPELFQRTNFGNRGASFSGDGRWLAYSSAETGVSQVYVRAFPDKGGHWQVSANGGTSPKFARNGKDLFYFDVPDDRIMVASYSVKGDSFIADKPRTWSSRSVALILSGAVGAQYDVSPDGKRIAVATYAGGSTQQDAGHVIFLENFIDELQRRGPLNGD